MSQLLLQPGARILFQGDSITDYGRSHEDDAQLGAGYANYVAAWLSSLYPERRLTFINRGVSGNRVYDMEERWTRDCIELQPDWVSILIGINDTWRRYDNNLLSPILDFEASYRRILERTKKETKAQLILLEPFVLPTPADRIIWREDLDPRIDVVRRLARDYGTLYIPYDGLFASACTQREPAFWADDGVHPTQAGSAFLAQAWIKVVEREA